jgi:hypothetical protein
MEESMNLLHDVWAHWRQDWHTNRTMFWFEFLGTMLSILATTILTIWAKTPPMLTCYIIWFLGSGMMMLGAYMRRASWMFLLMGFNTILNIVGLTILVLR